MKSVILSVIVVCCLNRVLLAQQQYEVPQPPGLTPEDCYFIDTYKTDFGAGAPLVRTERSFFFKKLFKNWGKRFGDCIPCCQNNAGYPATAGTEDYNGNGNSDSNYQETDQPNNGYDSGYNPPDIGPGHPGHIFVPFPHPHRIMSHLHGYFNRPFRRGGKTSVYDGNPPKDAYGEEKPGYSPGSTPGYSPGGATIEEEPAYETPAAVEEEKPTYSEQKDYSGSAESSEASKDDYGNKSDYKEEKKSENAYAPQAPPTPQIIQPIIPIVIPSVYLYPPQYYAPPAPYNPLPTPKYTPSDTPPAVPDAPSYTPPSVTPSYSEPIVPEEPSYSPPAESYSPPSSTYSEPAMPHSSLESYNSLFNPSNCSPLPNYYKRTYSTSLTYLLPPSSPCSHPASPSQSYNDVDQPMRSCPELFTSSYGGNLGSSNPY